MPRKSIYAFVLILVLLGVFGLWSFCHKRPLHPPSVTGRRQITHDGLVKTNLASDGSNLYFTEISGANSIISKTAVSGGEVSIFPGSLPSVQLLDVSISHSLLLAAENTSGPASEHPFWSYPLAGGPAQRLSDITGQEAVWSPDGQHLLFVKGSSLLVTSANGGPAKELVSVSGTLFHPRFSPDGRRIRFSVGDVSQNTASIWEVGSDGSGLHALLPDWQEVATKCCGSWTADGRYYLFQATEKTMASNANLWALAEPVGQFERKRVEQPVRLTQGTVSFASPIPSPDNHKIWALGLNVRGAVVKYDPASGKYVPYLAGISATDLDFSPDGQWVAYVAIPEGTLWRCRIDGSQSQQLTFVGSRAALPKWSPDGKEIAYVNVLEGKPWAIYIVPMSGGPAQLLISEKLTQIDINWSADGSKIIFGRITERKPEGLSIESYDRKTHELSAIPGSEGLFSPRVSPDGRYIAALSANLTRLMLFDTKSQKWSVWQTLESGALNYPVWSADSKSINFDDLLSGEGAYCRAKVGESHYEHVFLQKGIERYLGPFGLWSGRAPDGSVLFVQDTSTREAYELQVNLP